MYRVTNLLALSVGTFLLLFGLHENEGYQTEKFLAVQLNNLQVDFDFDLIMF